MNQDNQKMRQNCEKMTQHGPKTLPKGGESNPRRPMRTPRFDTTTATCTVQAAIGLRYLYGLRAQKAI